MAGGEYARFVPCAVCMGNGALTRAKRTREGVESDQYRCRKWHRFGLDWRTGPPTEPQWPVSDELRDALAELRRGRLQPGRLVAWADQAGLVGEHDQLGPVAQVVQVVQGVGRPR